MSRHFSDPKKASEAAKKAKPRGDGIFKKTVKETVLAAFQNLQADPKVNLTEWGKSNPTEFYKIAAKLIPTELTGAGGVPLFPPIIEMPDDAG